MKQTYDITADVIVSITASIEADSREEAITEYKKRIKDNLNDMEINSVSPALHLITDEITIENIEAYENL